jgi:hypothetical protein
MVLLVFAFTAVMFEKQDGIYTGTANNIGDLPFHLKVITSFAWGGNVPPEHPLYAGARFAYPFVADFLSAIFVISGADLRAAMLIPNVAFAFSMLVLLQHFTLLLTRDRLAGFIAPALVLFSGGLGWWLFLTDLFNWHGSISTFLLNLPQDYTIRSGAVWRWGNTLTTLFIPQRSFSLGAALALLSWQLWWTSGVTRRTTLTDERAPKKRLPMVMAGVITGLLPLVHAHTFLVVVTTAAVFTFMSRKYRFWIVYFVAAFIVAAPQLAWIASARTVQASTFLSWSPGWDHGQTNPLWFWILNTGVLIPILVFIFILQADGRPVIRAAVARYYFPFVAWFVLANFVKLAPWIWDNIKVLFYWFVASTPLVARLLSFLFSRGWSSRVLATLLFTSMTLAGALDVWRMISRAAIYREFDADGINMANFLRREAAPDSVVLHAPAYNSPVYLTGRRSLLGYTGIVWSHGLPYQERETDIRNIYKGASTSGNLLKQYGVDFILVGPHERDYGTVNEDFLARYAIVAESGAYRLYALPSSRESSH